MSRPCPREPVRDLTTRQAEVLEAMIGFLLARHRLPLLREMAEMMGSTSVNAAADLCNVLTHKGFLARDGHHHRVVKGPDGAPFTLTRGDGQ